MANKMVFITPGKYANVVAVHGNPLEDIAVLQEVTFVMQAGQMYWDAME